MSLKRLEAQLSVLTIYPESGGEPEAVLHDPAEISKALAGIGVLFEQWSANQVLSDDADQPAVLAAYCDSIERLTADFGFQSVDVISVAPNHPDKAALRAKFLDEHTHDDFEVRFFVAGHGLFYLHVGHQVFAILCTQGDLISVPQSTAHWFDLGENPVLKAIRLFTTPDGWVAQFTGSDIAARFPTLEQFLAQYA